jgi:hypothetical protein
MPLFLIKYNALQDGCRFAPHTCVDGCPREKHALLFSCKFTMLYRTDASFIIRYNVLMDRCHKIQCSKDGCHFSANRCIDGCQQEKHVSRCSRQFTLLYRKDDTFLHKIQCSIGRMPFFPLQMHRPMPTGEARPSVFM